MIRCDARVCVEMPNRRRRAARGGLGVDRHLLQARGASELLQVQLGAVLGGAVRPVERVAALTGKRAKAVQARVRHRL